MYVDLLYFRMPSTSLVRVGQVNHFSMVALCQLGITCSFKIQHLYCLTSWTIIYRNRNSRWTRFLGISIALSSGVFMTIYSRWDSLYFNLLFSSLYHLVLLPSLLKLLIEMDSMQVALVRGVIQVDIMSNLRGFVEEKTILFLIWINFSRTRKMVKMWHFFLFFFELCCDQTVWLFLLFSTVLKKF